MIDDQPPNILGDFDEVMDKCRARAASLYQADGILSHERVAHDLGRFLFDRLCEQPSTPERDALLSLINHDYRVATYLSTGQRAIVSAMARLIRLALPYAGHDGYRDEWRTEPELEPESAPVVAFIPDTPTPFDKIIIRRPGEPEEILDVPPAVPVSYSDQPSYGGPQRLHVTLRAAGWHVVATLDRRTYRVERLDSDTE